MRPAQLTSILFFLIVTIFLGGPAIVFGAEPTSGALMKEAVAAAAKITDADEKADTLSYIAMTQARTGDFAGAKQTAEVIEQDLKKHFAYGHIADAMAMSGDIDGAKAIAASMSDADAKSGVFESIVEAQAAKGDIAAAKASAANVTDPFYAAQAAKSIALAQAKAGDFDGAMATMGAITKSDDVKEEAYAEIALIQLKSGKQADAEKTFALAVEATKHAPDYLASMALQKIAGAETKFGRVSTAMRIANAAPPDDKSSIFFRIAEAQLEMEDVAAAKTTVAQVTDPDQLVDFSRELAPLLLKKGDKAGAAEQLQLAKAGIDKMPNSPPRAFVSEGVATAIVQVEGAAAAADWARAQTDPEVRARSLIGVVDFLPDYHGPGHP